MIESIINSFVQKSCLKSENRLTEGFYTEHIKLVVSYADQLAEILKADREIVRIAAFLHDISAVLDFSSLSDHAFNSAEIARSILTVNQYPYEKIQKVVYAIQTHSTPLKIGEGSPEQICISNADAMAQIASPTYWLYYAFSIKNLSFNDGYNWYLNQVMDNWNQLINPAQEIIQEKYLLIHETFQYNQRFVFEEEYIQTVKNKPI